MLSMILQGLKYSFFYFVFPKRKNYGMMQNMFETDETQFKEPIIIIEEKGDLEHAIRCTEQARQRAGTSWMKQACSYRIKMLQMQLAKQKNKNIR